jgi:Cof subfamily protein (haloacid dehalogenase superfamily)
MTYKILFLDIDGTILNPDHTYHPKTKEAIEQVQEQGIEVFLATGRPANELKEIAKELNIESYISYNGAYTIYQEEAIVHAPMKVEMVKEFLAIAKKFNHEILLQARESNYVTDTKSTLMKDFIELFQLEKIEGIHEEKLDDILGVNILNVHPEEAAHYELNEDIRLAQIHVNGAQDSYDIIRKSMNKGEAVKIVLEKLGISPAEAIAFGDGMNDKEMLQTVGASFAMGNAHPELFQYATFQTTAVSEAGVFTGLQQLGLVK